MAVGELLPPSPALTDEDIDAILAAQGPISRFGTPPPAKKQKVEEVVAEPRLLPREHSSYGFGEVAAGGQDYTIAAQHFATTLSHHTSPLYIPTAQITNILTLAKLPNEIVAVAFNILQAWTTKQQTPLLRRNSANNADFLLVSALALANHYLDDHPWAPARWSRKVCRYRWRASTIDRTMMEMFAALGWCLGEFCTEEAVCDAMATLFARPQSHVEEDLSGDRRPAEEELLRLKLEPLRVEIEGTSTVWANGQLTPLTPGTTPPFAGAVMPEDDRRMSSLFLPLL